MNTDTQTQNAGGNDVVARIINVLVTEVLLKVEGRINEQLVSLSNRMIVLERSQDTLSSLPIWTEDWIRAIDALPTEERVRELIDEDAVAPRYVQDLRDKLDEIDSRLEDAESDIRDLEDDKVSSADLEDAIRDSARVSQACQDPESIVRDGLKAIIDGKI
jgi:hypothetical protein